MTLRSVLALLCAATALAACSALPQRHAAVCHFDRAGDGLGGTGVGSDILMRLVNATDRGIGGTGIDTAGSPQSTDQRGLGGTGITADTEDRGIGGTGIGSRNIGSTGIVGIVTGFASICVNGYDVALTDDSEITVEGLPAVAGDIKLGQLVEIEARIADGKYTATSLNVRLAVAGPVSSMAADKSSLVVAGQTINVAGFGGSAVLSDVDVGSWVAVSGLRRGDDVIVGTSVVPLPTRGTEILVAGPIRLDDTGLRRIGGLVLNDTTMAAGQRIVVRGTAAADRLVASAMMPETAPAFAARVAQMSVQAFATALDPARINLGNLTINRDIVTSALRSDFASRIVQIEGSFGNNHIFTTERLLIPERPIDGVVLPERPGPITLPPVITSPGAPGGGTVTLPGRPEILPLQPGNSVPVMPGTPIDRPPVEIPPGFIRPETPGPSATPPGG